MIIGHITCVNTCRTLEELGTGEFGVVNRGTWKPSSTKEVKVAIKTLNIDSTDKDRLRFLQEAAIMCQFDHENVIKLYGVVTNAPAMIILEYMSRGDLRNVLMHLQPSYVTVYDVLAQSLYIYFVTEMETLQMKNCRLFCSNFVKRLQQEWCILVLKTLYTETWQQGIFLCLNQRHAR